MHCNGRSRSSGRGRTRMRSMHPRKPQGSKLRHPGHIQFTWKGNTQASGPITAKYNTQNTSNWHPFSWCTRVSHLNSKSDVENHWQPPDQWQIRVRETDEKPSLFSPLPNLAVSGIISAVGRFWGGIPVGRFSRGFFVVLYVSHVAALLAKWWERKLCTPKAFWPYVTIAASFLLAFVDCIPFLFIEHMTNVLSNARMAEIVVAAAVCPPNPCLTI